MIVFSEKGKLDPKSISIRWTLHVHDRADGSVPYEIFRKSLDAYTRATLDISVEEILARQGHNVCANSKLGKNLKNGLYEFKVAKSLSVLCNDLGIELPSSLARDGNVLLRVFFAVEGEKIVILLSGYDKKRDDKGKRQNREIKLARALLVEHKSKVIGR